jgi:hypothetical protein
MASEPGTPRVGTASRHWTCTPSTRGEPGSGPAKPIPPVHYPLLPPGTRHPTRQKPVPVRTGRVSAGKGVGQPPDTRGLTRAIA